MLKHRINFDSPKLRLHAIRENEGMKPYYIKLVTANFSIIADYHMAFITIREEE